MTTTAKRLAAVLTSSACLAVVGITLALSYNGLGGVFILLSIFVLPQAFPGTRLAVLLAILGAMCLFVTWATLNGGASSWTAVPWAVAGVGFAAAAALVVMRRRRIRPDEAPRRLS